MKKQYIYSEQSSLWGNPECIGFGSEFYELNGVIYHSIQTRRKDNNSKLTLYLRENKQNLKRLNLRQFRYIKFLDQREKKKCLLKEQDYPKHYK